MNAVEEFRPMFADAGFPICAKIRVSCAFPTTHRRSGALGQAFPDVASADRAFEIMVAPSLDQPRDVVAVLVSQLCHATSGALSHATVAYKRAAEAMSLEPVGINWRVTRPTALFDEAFGAIIAGLGDYPHAALSVEGPKTQSTRMLKATCPTCGYIIRVSNKWAAKGLPVCGIDGDSFNIEEEAAQ